MEAFSCWFSQLQWGELIKILLSAFSCIVCIVLHELCHGLAALAQGDDTARRKGRLTLNPLKHIDPIGLIMLFTVHFGWAKPVPVDPRRFKDPRKSMALTALAGPAGNLLLAFLMIPAYAGAAVWHQNSGDVLAYYLAVFFVSTATLSIGLAVFNLFPIPPLDGSKVLFSLLPPQWYWKLMRYERYGMIALVVLMYLGIFNGPLSFLRDAIFDIMFSAVGEPVVRWLLS